MFRYEKKLQYPVQIKNPNPALAKFIMSQYGGPDGELGASMRYLSQRYSMPYPELRGLLTDIGTEELGHFEMVATIIHQLTRNMTEEEIKKAGMEAYFVDHTAGVFPQFASGMAWTSATIGVKGDVITDLTEDLAADAASTETQQSPRLHFPPDHHWNLSAALFFFSNGNMVNEGLDDIALQLYRKNRLREQLLLFFFCKLLRFSCLEKHLQVLHIFFNCLLFAPKNICMLTKFRLTELPCSPIQIQLPQCTVYTRTSLCVYPDLLLQLLVLYFFLRGPIYFLHQCRDMQILGRK